MIQRDHKMFQSKHLFRPHFKHPQPKGVHIELGHDRDFAQFFSRKNFEAKAVLICFVALVKALNPWLHCAFGNVLQLIPREQFAKLSLLWFSFIPTVITFFSLRNDPVGSILENKTKKTTPFES